MKKISVIVPLYLGKKYINNILLMIDRNKDNLQKDKIDVEIETIFINDFPIEKIELKNTKSVKIYVNEKNIGIHASRVKGFQYASGEYILFLDQDDYIAENYVLNQFKFLENKDADAVICNGYYRERKVIYQNNNGPKMDRTNFFNYKNPIISPGQVLIKRDAIPVEWTKNIMKYSGADDYLLWIMMIVNCKKFLYNNDILYTHIEYDTNTSFNWKKMIYSIEEMYSYAIKSSKINDIEKNKLKDIVDKIINKHELYHNFEIKREKLYKQGKSIADSLKKRNIEEVAVYGYGVIGKRFVSELVKNKIKVAYIVDQDTSYSDLNIPIYSLKEKFPYTEVLIVTPLFAYEEILQKIKNQRINQIISIGEFIEEVLKEK